MTYTEIRREIGKRLGDNDLNKYKGLVSNSFLQAIGEVMLSGDCDPVEYPELYKEEALQLGTFMGKTAVDYPSKMLKLIDIRARDVVFTKEITKEEFERMTVEDAFEPTLNEIFWYQDNKFIWLIAPTSNEIIIPAVFAVYLQNPDSTSWSFSTNLIEDLKYGRNFIYKCIDKAVANIAAMPMLQPVQPTQVAKGR